MVMFFFPKAPMGVLLFPFVLDANVVDTVYHFLFIGKPSSFLKHLLEKLTIGFYVFCGSISDLLAQVSVTYDSRYFSFFMACTYIIIRMKQNSVFLMVR